MNSSIGAFAKTAKKLSRNPLGIIALFICMSFTPSVAVYTVKKPSIPVSNGDTLYVGGTGEDNYTRIQKAIDNASDGDTVFVYDDSSPYYEFVEVNKSIFMDLFFYFQLFM